MASVKFSHLSWMDPTHWGISIPISLLRIHSQSPKFFLGLRLCCYCCFIYSQTSSAFTVTWCAIMKWKTAGEKFQTLFFFFYNSKKKKKIHILILCKLPGKHYELQKGRGWHHPAVQSGPVTTIFWHGWKSFYMQWQSIHPAECIFKSRPASI